MNKHLYYNDLKIIIGSAAQENTPNQEIIEGTKENSESLKKAIKEFLQPENKKNLFVRSNDVQYTFDELKKEFKDIVAAGGLIQNGDKYLFIKRLGKWDLPKGKLDKNETIEAAAIRECEEECAVEGLNILKPLPDTYHIFDHKKGFALKTTHWFHMETSSNKELKPQTEENIEEVKWFTLEEIKNIALENTYMTIERLVRDFFKF